MFSVARSSNGKTRPFGGCYAGSNPARAAILRQAQDGDDRSRPELSINKALSLSKRQGWELFSLSS